MNGQASRLIELLRLDNSHGYEKTGKIISVCSGKGGTGKTFFSANLALHLSMINKKVLLIDLDLNFSNLNILLNSAVENTIGDFFSRGKSLNQVINHYSTNLNLIFGDSGKSGGVHTSIELLENLFSSLEKISVEYDFIILDSSAGGSEFIASQLIHSDHNIIVLSPEPTSVMDAYVLIKILHENNFSGNNFAVVNKCMNSHDGRNAFSNLSTASEHFLGENIKFLGELSFSKEAYNSIMNQDLLIKTDPESGTASQIMKCASSFLKFIQVANNNQSLLTK